MTRSGTELSLTSSSLMMSNSFKFNWDLMYAMLPCRMAFWSNGRLMSKATLPTSATSFFMNEANCMVNLIIFLSLTFFPVHPLSSFMKVVGRVPVASSYCSCIHFRVFTFHSGYESEMTMEAVDHPFLALPACPRKRFKESLRNLDWRDSILSSSSDFGHGACTARPSLPSFFHMLSDQCGHTGQIMMTTLSAHLWTMSLCIAMPLSLHQLR
mmetsp:Transcript_2785/g.7734  ORF Transcript_2785/g.7734 Transcript_2785/m.7734 type:complete len:212 (-) Transcript_2785:582-1217(-)